VSLGERIASVTTQPGGRCSVGLLRATLTPAQVEEFDEFAASGIPASVLARAVNAEYGTRISGQSMARHRRRDCQCP